MMTKKTLARVNADWKFVVRFCPCGAKEWEERYYPTRVEAETARRAMEAAKIPTLRVVEVSL